MSGFQDVRDVMDISGPGEPTPKPPPAKKQKTVEKRPDGITRELFALLGENPPPVAIVENKFKEKPRWMGKANPWIWKPFKNPARTDDLVLHHWERKSDLPADESSLSYRFSKFNVKPDIPTYTDGEYESILRDSDWTRAETDYLFNMCREYDLRFFIIWDRYDPPATTDPNTTTATPPRTRSVEDLKSRYYSVYRSLMELRTPLNRMTPEETVLFNTMNFDKDRETARKRMAAILFDRTPEQVKEEEMLLTELKRIVLNQQRTLEERKDLFNRLDSPSSQGSISAYTGTQGLQHLRDMILSGSDKNKKRKSIAMGSSGGGGGGGGGNGAQGGSGTGMNGENTPSQTQAQSTAAEKAASSAAQKDKDTPIPKKSVRALSPEEMKLFGVNHHDKLSAGVKFRSAMVQTSFKGVTAQKVQQALAQLQIAQRLTMPTTKTVQKFEELQSAVGTLLETKKLLEKVEQEFRVLKAQQEAAAKEDQ